MRSPRDPAARESRSTGIRLGATAQVNRSARIRGDNLAAVLQAVHHTDGLTRAELTRRLGLNRSTVAALVADLVHRGLVHETPPVGAGEVGRPSPKVTPDRSTVAVAVNPEVDAVTVALVALGGVVLDRQRHVFDSVPSAAQVADVASGMIRTLLGTPQRTFRVVGIGVAVPGLVDSAGGIVRLAPHLGWSDEPFAERLASAAGLGVVIANDATLGTIAERQFGAGRGADDLFYINGGASGIGGGIIAGGLVLGGSNGLAGEIGHTFVAPDPATDPSGSPGSLETRVSRRRLLNLLGSSVSAQADPDEFDRALLSSTDHEVHREVDSQLGYLAISIANVVNILNPGLVILGGFLASLDAARPDELDRLVSARALADSTRHLHIVRAELGSSLLMIGAAELAFSALLSDPSAHRVEEPSAPAPESGKAPESR